MKLIPGKKMKKQTKKRSWVGQDPLIHQWNVKYDWNAERKYSKKLQMSMAERGIQGGNHAYPRMTHFQAQLIYWL